MSRWSPRDAQGEPDGLILFDGVCILCSRWVRFVIDRDPRRLFRFVTIQSDRGRALAARFGIDPDTPQTNAVIWNGRIHFKSDAALTVLGQLRTTRAFAALRVVPKSVRDFAYDQIAGNRYRLFGRADQCMVSSAEDRARFLT